MPQRGEATELRFFKRRVGVFAASAEKEASVDILARHTDLAAFALELSLQSRRRGFLKFRLFADAALGLAAEKPWEFLDTQAQVPSLPCLELRVAVRECVLAEALRDTVFEVGPALKAPADADSAGETHSLLCMKVRHDQPHLQPSAPCAPARLQLLFCLLARFF